MLRTVPHSPTCPHIRTISGSSADDSVPVSPNSRRSLLGMVGVQLLCPRPQDREQGREQQAAEARADDLRLGRAADAPLCLALPDFCTGLGY